jgi:methylmalonyl-CoA mutase
LLEESNVARVADPAAGSGGIEELTDKLCHAAWTLFQEIEAAGGAPSALEKGVIQGKIAKTRAEHENAVAHRKEALTGTSDYPLLSEAPFTVLDATPVPIPPPAAAIRYPALVPHRLAEPFEALRDASDRMLATAGRRPRIFLANLGAPADFTARATFAKNLFEAGGIEAVSNDGFTDHGALATALKRSGAQLACLCGSDERYATDAADVVKALKDAGATHLWAAGKPGKLEADLRLVGMESFVYHGCDILQALRDVHRRLGL